MKASPPRTAERVLAALLAREDRATVLSELGELYATRCARDGRAAANGWYRRQVAAFALALARHGRRGAARARRSRFAAALDKRERQRGGGEMGDVAKEFGYAVRRLVRAPVFSTVAVATIAVGIGAFTSIYGLVDAVLLEEMPYEDPDELHWVWRDYVEADFPRGWLGGPDIVAMREQGEVFERIVAFRTGSRNLSDDAGTSAERITVHFVTGGFFELLGVRPHLGRGPTEAEVGPDGPAVVVLSWELWRTRFGADPELVGRSVLMNGTPTEVIGVAPEGFRFVKHGSLADPAPADAYLPLPLDLATSSPGSGAYAALARIDRETHPDQVAAALATAAEPVNDFMAQYDASPVRLWTVGLTEDLIAPVRPALVALMGSATFLLLVLAGNLATLLLGRAAAREHEMGVRVALGAGRGDLLAGVLAESAVLAVLGALGGVLLARAGSGLLVALAPDDLPRLHAVAIDGSVLAVACAVTAAMVVASGLLPAWTALRSRVDDALRRGGTRGAVSGGRTRSVLVAGQVALSMALLVGATVTGQAFAELLREDPGFDVGETLTFGTPLPSGLYDSDAILAFHREVRERIAALPGVTEVGGGSTLPLSLTADQSGLSFPGAPGNVQDDQLDNPLVDIVRATPGFPEAAGFRTLAGRTFRAGDGEDGAFPIVIDDVLANRFFPGGGAVGAIALFAGDTATVIGVIDQPRLYTVHADDRGQIYVPLPLQPVASLSYAVRTTGDARSLTAPIRALLRGVDATVPMSDVRTLDEVVRGSLGEQRLSMTLIVAFALGALVLALLGIYGVVSNDVARRRQEIGVRMALGADPGGVVRMVLRQGLKLSVLGAATGIGVTVALTGVVERVMVGVDAGDPLVHVAVAFALIVVAGLASYIPARRAVRIDPTEALRPD